MPAYEYLCKNCGAHYNLRLPPDHEMPVCHFCDRELVQVIHPPGIAFVGEGFHCNDYPNEKGGKP